jgi:hypothetical protein
MSQALTTRLFDVSQQSHQLVQTHSLLQADLDLLFIYIMRIPTVFQEAQAHLEPEYFDAHEIQYAIFWSALRDLMKTYNNISYEMVAAEINRRLTINPVVGDDIRYQMIQPNPNGLVWMLMCQHFEPSILNAAHARDLLRQFLIERTVIRPTSRVASQARNGTYPQDFMRFITQAMEQYQRVEAIRDIPLGGMMPERGAALPPPIQYVPTGLGFVDTYIKGQRRGDCNGLLGVFGSGKTTMGLQMALENAQNAALQAQMNNTVPELTVFLSYEEPQSKVEKRIWSYAAKIRRDKLEDMRDWNVLTQQHNMEAYERALSAAGDAGVQYSETERWDIAREWLNPAFVLLDMSGSENFPGAGNGYVDEAAALITRLSDQRQQPIRAVFADYAGLICKRYMESNGIAEERMRYYLNGIGDKFRRQIAERHNCTAWLLHQFNGDQNKRNPTTLLLSWSKVRYYQDRSAAAPTLQICGKFGGMIDVSNRYVPDPNTRSFIDPSSRSSLEGDATPRPARRGPPGLRDASLGALAGDSEY